MVWANIKKELSHAMHRAGISKEMRATEIVEIAQTVLDQELPATLRSDVDVVYFKDKTLALRAASSIAAQEMKLREGAILDSLNKRFGKNIITHLRYML